MPTVTTRRKSRAGRKRICDRCSRAIQPGEVYYEWSFRYNGIRTACSAHYPRASELTVSKMAGAYATIERAEDALQEAIDADEVTAAVQSACEDVRAVAVSYRKASVSLGGAGAQTGTKADLLLVAADQIEEWEVEGELMDAREQARQFISTLVLP